MQSKHDDASFLPVRLNQELAFLPQYLAQLPELLDF